MATSPFELFRRNLKPLMIALTVLAMFAFVVLPALQSYQQMNRPGGTTQTTVASYEGGTFDINEIDYFNRNHNLTLRFLSALAENTMERGGTPQVPGFSLDPQTGGIRSLGINSTVSRQTAVTAKLFAEQAQEMGMELDDAALRSWLDRYVDGKLTPAEMNGVLARATENQLGQYHLYEQLRTHLLASAAQQVLTSGLVGGNGLATPPAEQFEMFRRLNQQASVTAYPVLVDDFLEKVDGEPSEADIEAIYEEGKERYPDEMSAKPAFRRPATRVFEYVTADVEKFIEAEMETIPEEELRAEYEQRVAGGAFRLPQSPSQTAPPSDAAEPPAGDAPADPAATEDPTTPENATEPAAEASESADTAAADDQPAADAQDDPEMTLDTAAPSEQPAQPAAPAEDAPPADDTAADDSSADDSSADDSSADEASDDQEQPAVEEVTEEENAEEPAEDTEPAPEDGAALDRSASPFRFTAFSPQDEPAEPAADDAETPEPAEAPPADADQPSTPATPDQPTDVAAEPADEAERSDSEDEPDAPAADAGDTPAPASDAETIPEQPAADAADAQAADGQTAPAEDQEPQAKPFEEVREEIARQLATAPAIEKARTATRKVVDAMRRYFTRKAIYDTGADKTAEPPVRPDLEAMAEELGLEYHKTEPLNQFELQDHPLGNTVTPGVDMQTGERFVNLAFADSLPLESPIQTESMSNRQPYVTWVVAATEESIPELSEVRDEVIAHWRMDQARALAEKAADDLAARANETDQPLAELVPEDRQSLVAEDIGPFPWMLWLGRGRPIEWSVQELDRTGKEFMQQVFFQPLDRYDVAPNAPKTVYYTVKTNERTPSTKELRERFMRANERQPISALASESIGEIQQGYFESFQEEIGLEWTEE